MRSPRAAPTRRRSAVRVNGLRSRTTSVHVVGRRSRADTRRATSPAIEAERDRRPEPQPAEVGRPGPGLAGADRPGLGRAEVARAERDRARRRAGPSAPGRAARPRRAGTTTWRPRPARAATIWSTIARSIRASAAAASASPSSNASRRFGGSSRPATAAATASSSRASRIVAGLGHRGLGVVEPPGRQACADRRRERPAVRVADELAVLEPGEGPGVEQGGVLGPGDPGPPQVALRRRRPAARAGRAGRASRRAGSPTGRSRAREDRPQALGPGPRGDEPDELGRGGVAVCLGRLGVGAPPGSASQALSGNAPGRGRRRRPVVSAARSSRAAASAAAWLTRPSTIQRSANERAVEPQVGDHAEDGGRRRPCRRSGSCRRPGRRPPTGRRSSGRPSPRSRPARSAR